MPSNKTRRQAGKTAERKGPRQKTSTSDLKTLEARRDQLRSSSMPDVQQSIAGEITEKLQKTRPHSAEDTSDHQKIKFKTLLQCMLAGEWISALGRMANIEEKSPELSQANVNISF